MSQTLKSTVFAVNINHAADTFVEFLRLIAKAYHLPPGTAAACSEERQPGTTCSVASARRESDC